MTLQWFLAGAAALVSLIAFLRMRRVSKRLDRLSESYWELRYEYGQLSGRVARLEGSPEDEPKASPSQPTATTFVPLSSLKR